MRLTYDALRVDEISGPTQTDYLVSLDARLCLLDVTGLLVIEEPGFPVVELARSLKLWLPDLGIEDFGFRSMSFEEVGTVEFRRYGAHWVASSVLSPGVQTSPMSWVALSSACEYFIARVERDLRGLRLDPSLILAGPEGGL